MTSLERYKARLRDHRWYAKTFERIRTKGGGLVPFQYNKAQEALGEVWDQLEREGKPVRIIVLKARREGVSTYVAGRFMHKLCTKRYLSALVIAHEDKSTDKLFKIYKLMYEQLPTAVQLTDGTRVRVRPKKRYSTKRELDFQDLNSDIIIATAGSDKGKQKQGKRGSGTGRGATLHLLHVSEVAFYPSGKQTLVALLQTVDKSPSTAVILESTANGVGDEFHGRWLDAKAGKSDYVPLFLSWLTFPEYRSPAPSEGLGQLDTEEKRLKEQFGATDEQLQWRRETIRNECGGDPVQFRQEYPADDQEAFLVGGHPFFDYPSVVRARDKHEKPPAFVGRLEYVKDGRGQLTTKVEFIPDPGGYLWVWAKPKPYGAYCVGGDVAEGKEVETEKISEKYDFCCAHVLDRDTCEQAAEWHGRVDPDTFGDEMVKLGRWYNEAWIAPEVNKHGITTARRIVTLRYSRLYRRKAPLDEAYPDTTEKLGWWTGPQNRPLMLDDLHRGVREDTHIIHSSRLIGEMFTFVRDATGKPAAQEGCHDDTVMAAAITIQLHQLCPMTRPEDPKVLAERKRHAEQAARQRDKYTGY
jgi:hypothetical protein